MAQSASVACAVVGIADIVGMVEITAGHCEAGREPIPGAAASEPPFGRDADGLGIDGGSSRPVGGGGTREPERTGSQPAGGLAGNAVPSGNRFGFRFWRKAKSRAYRGRPWARATALVMLGSIT